MKKGDFPGGVFKQKMVRRGCWLRLNNTAGLTCCWKKKWFKLYAPQLAVVGTLLL